MVRIFNHELKKVTDNEAAKQSVDEIDKFLKKIGLWITMEEKGMPKTEINALAKQCMVIPDYKENPRVATEEEMVGLVKQSYEHL